MLSHINSNPVVSYRLRHETMVSQEQIHLKPVFWQPGHWPIEVKHSTLDISSIELDLANEFIESSDGASFQGPTAEKLKRQMELVFRDTGLVYLTGNKHLTCSKQLKALAELLVPEASNYQGGANQRVELESNVYDTGAPKSADIHYHHEMAYVDRSPKTISFLCLEAPSKGPSGLKGATFLSDNTSVTREILKTPLGQKLKEKGLIYVRKLTDRDYMSHHDSNNAVYNHWQHSFETDDWKLAQEKAEQEKGLKVEWEDHPIYGRYMVTKYHVSAFEYHPDLDENLLYSSIADDEVWFDSWPGMKDVPRDDRPLQLLFGDGSPMSKEEKKLFMEAYEKFGFPISWNKGDLAVICNYRYAHGRPKYELDPGEKRELAVIIGEGFKRTGPKEDKWFENSPQMNPMIGLRA